MGYVFRTKLDSMGFCFFDDNISFSDLASICGNERIFFKNNIQHDYTGARLTNLTELGVFIWAQHADVPLERHVIVNCGSAILPGAVLEGGVGVGVLSMVHKRPGAFGTYVGKPTRRVLERKRDSLGLDKAFLNSLKIVQK